MIEALSQTKGALQSAHKLGIQAAGRIARFRLASAAVAAILLVMLFDLFFPVPGPVRGTAIVSIIAYEAWSLWSIRKASRIEDVRLDRAARLVEDRHPELNNALINAVQFEARLIQRNGDTSDQSAGLMRREMARAEQAAVTILPKPVAEIAEVRRSRQALAVVFGVAILSLVLFPRFWRFEAPRLLLFWKDSPPFTLTDFMVTPGDAHVRSGGSLSIQVKTGGLVPDSLILVTVNGGRERSMPLSIDDDSVYSQTLENIGQDTGYFVRGSSGRSKRYSILVDSAPEAQNVRATLQPPAYSGRPKSVITVGRAGIAGLNGTSVVIDVEASRPLKNGKFTLVAATGEREEFALIPQSGRPEIAHGRFTIRRDSVYQIDLRGADGTEKPHAARGKVVLQRDEKPLVYITTPGQNAVVTPAMQVPIRAEAEDDVAVQRIEIHLIVNGMADSAKVFTMPSRQARAEAEIRLDLGDLGALPGDVIQYYATAYDNDPGKTGRPNLTDSERRWLWVVSDKDYRKILDRQRGLPQLAAEYRAQTGALDSVANRQRALADRAASIASTSMTPLHSDSGSENARRSHKLRQDWGPGGRGQGSKLPQDWGPGGELKAVHREQAKIRQEAEEIGRAMKNLARQKPQFDVERGLQRKLAGLARQVETAAAGPMKQAESATSPSSVAEHSSRAARQLEMASGMGLESVEKALTAMEKAAPLYDDVKRLRELTRQQTDLAIQARQQAGAVKQDAFQQSRMAELAQRQEETRLALNELRSDLNEHASQAVMVAPLSASRSAKQAVQLTQALDSMAVSERMGEAASSFRNQNGLSGAAQAELAQRSLEQLFKQGKGVQSTACTGLDRQLSLCLGQGAGSTFEQLSQGMNQGQSQGAGQGQGIAQVDGGQPAPRPGSRPGDASGQTGGQQRQAAALTTLTSLTRMQQRAGHGEKRENRRHQAARESPAALGGEDVERVEDVARPPTPAADSATGRYPAEYRRLVKDYFKAVAGGK